MDVAQRATKASAIRLGVSIAVVAMVGIGVAGCSSPWTPLAHDPSTRAVPNVVGLQTSAAETEILDAGLKFEVLSTPGGPPITITSPPPHVVNESPARGHLKPGQTVKILVVG
jgi:beta-lactam-binding protein with PASTA domain